MKINRKTQLDSEIPTASMPDIIFMLLIFYHYDFNIDNVLQ